MTTTADRARSPRSGRRRGFVSAIVVLAAVAGAACGSTVQVAGSDGGVGDGDGLAPVQTSTTDALGEGGVPTASTPSTISVPRPGGGRGGLPGAPATTTTAPAPGGGGGRSSQGVTADEMKIGVYLADTSGLAGQVEGLRWGDGKRQVEGLLDYLERKGGIAGRTKLTPVFHVIQITDVASAQAEQQACTTFTEDNQVFAVIHALNAQLNVMLACLARKNTPLITAGGGAWDEALMQEYAPFAFLPANTSLTRIARFWPERLVAEGFLTQTARIGLLRVDNPEFDRATEQSLKPVLQRHGLTLTEEVELPRGAGEEAIANAVLRFRTSRVDRLLIFDNAVVALPFVLQAQAQNYRPLYGFNSTNLPQWIADNAAPGYLDGSVGVGWQSALDVDTAQEDVVTATTTECDTLMRDIGQADVDRPGKWVQRGLCDDLFFLKAALDTTTDVTPEGLYAAASALGDGYVPASTFSTRFAPGRMDGAETARYFVYESACSCLRYATPPSAMG